MGGNDYMANTVSGPSTTAGAIQNSDHSGGGGLGLKQPSGPMPSDKSDRSGHKTPQESANFKRSPHSATDGNLDFILDIPLEITVELGRTKMLINDLLKLGQGSVIELTKAAGETLEILANQRLIAKGDVVVINEKYGIRLTEVVTPVERIERLG
jgi:flagellar motor switch protein FliN/FliY